MAEEAYRLDDKYTTGIWYDTMNGDFAKIQRGFDPDSEGDGRIVELVNPETDGVYYDMPVREWVEKEQQHFTQVLQAAVDDPVNFYRTTVENLVDAAQYQGRSLPFSEEISFRYAQQHVEITES